MHQEERMQLALGNCRLVCLAICLLDAQNGACCIYVHLESVLCLILVGAGFQTSTV